MLIDAPCLVNIAMASVSFHIAACNVRVFDSNDLIISVMLIDAPCFINIAMASVLLYIAIMYGCITPTISFIYIGSVLQEQSNDVTVALYCKKSAVRSYLSIQSTGTPSFSIFSTLLTSPSIAALWNCSTRSSSISMEGTVKSKQFDVCETLYHSVQSATSVNSQFFRKCGYLTIKYPGGDGNSAVIIQCLTSIT